MSDNIANVPGSVTVIFPRADKGVDNGLFYPLAIFGTGHLGTQPIHSSAVAEFQGGDDPVNVVELQALAAKISADFWAWRLASLEVRYESVVPWVSDGFSDVEYLHGYPGITTAVHRSEWEPENGNLQHAGIFGSAPDDNDSIIAHTSAPFLIPAINGTVPVTITTTVDTTIWMLEGQTVEIDDGTHRVYGWVSDIDSATAFTLTLTRNAVTPTAWSASTPYVVGNEVSLAGTNYTCSAVPPAWNGATVYIIGDAVVVAGAWYHCILGHTNHTPPNGTYWALGVTPPNATYWSVGVSMATGAACIISGDPANLLAAITSINGDTTAAQRITSSGETVAITQPIAGTTNLEVAFTGYLRSIQSETGPAITMGVGTSGSDANWTHAANVVTYNLPDAAHSKRGAVTTGAQEFAGVKTLTADHFYLANDSTYPITSRAGFYYFSPGGPNGLSIVSSRGLSDPNPISGDNHLSVEIIAALGGGGGPGPAIASPGYMTLRGTYLLGPAAWNSGTAYVVGDDVSLGSVFYHCILNHTNHAPPNATYWTLNGSNDWNDPLFKGDAPYYAVDYFEGGLAVRGSGVYGTDPIGNVVRGGLIITIGSGTAVTSVSGGSTGLVFSGGATPTMSGVLNTGSGGLGTNTAAWTVGEVPMADGVGNFAPWIPSGIGAPSPTMGEPNAVYFDMTDPSNPKLYWKT